MARDFALAAVAGFAAFGALYLLGAFMAASFSIAQWQPTMRVLVGIFGFGFGLAITFGTAAMLTERKRQNGEGR